MPSVSEKQRKMMGAALRAKRTGKGSAKAKKVAKGMSDKQLSEFATKPKKRKRK